ncbi:unnamed protein product, partial [Didymodactylos carnosus]
QIENCHRVGKPVRGKGRPIIVRFYSRPLRQQILRATYLLKQNKSNVFIVEDLTRKTLELFHSVRASLPADRKRSVITRNGRVYRKNPDNTLTPITDFSCKDDANQTSAIYTSQLSHSSNSLHQQHSKNDCLVQHDNGGCD